MELAAAPSASREPQVEPRAEPRNRRELAEAIFSECDPVQVGRELLTSGSEKGASVRARVFEMLVDWQFGKPAEARETKLRIIWDLPCPPRELLDDDDEPGSPHELKN